MSKTLFLVAGGPSTLSADGYYAPAGKIIESTTETQRQVTLNQSGVFKELQVNIQSNTSTVADIYLRVNGANSALTVNYTSGQSGLKQDISNTVTTASGDEVNYFVDLTSGTSLLPVSVSTTFYSDVGTYSLFVSNGAPTGQNDNLTRYYSFSGLSAASTETDAQMYNLCGGDFKHFFVNVTTGGSITSSVFSLSVNASTSGCPTVTYTTSQSGFKEDTSTTKTVVVGDLCTFKCVTSSEAGTQTITFSTISCGFYSTGGSQQLYVFSPNATQSNSLTRYNHITGQLNFSTTETNRYHTFYAGNCMGVTLCEEITVNNITTNPSSTLTLRVNQAASSLNLTFTGSQTGTKTSITDSARIVNDDELSLESVTGTTGSTSITIQQMSLCYMPQPLFYKMNNFNFNEIDEGDVEIG